tara:strand:+ start:22984 stop:23193 length:210 start_codon:yes stop_codon:yes gene_type:complete
MAINEPGKGVPVAPSDTTSFRTKLGEGYSGTTQAEKCKNLCAEIANMPDSDLRRDSIKRAKQAGCGCGK